MGPDTRLPAGSAARDLDGRVTDRGTSSSRLVEDLRRRVDEVVASLVPRGRDCALLDFPDHVNLGDSAIWLGERATLRRCGVRVVYAADVMTFSADALRRHATDLVILLSGGGNVGDLYPHLQRFRESVIRAFPDRRIIQLPQSIHFQAPDNLQRARATFEGHPNFTLLVRDQPSFDFARREFGVPIRLCPDMAFGLGMLPRPRPPSDDIVFLLRDDIEARPATRALGSRVGASATDWLSDPGSVLLAVDKWLRRQMVYRPSIAPIVAPRLARVWTAANVWDRLAWRRVERGLKILSRGRVVVTDRLHGHILSMLLGIPNVFLDNSYGKLGAHHRTWTHASPLSLLAEDADSALGHARRLLTTSDARP